MFLYKAINKKTGRVFIGLSKIKPHKILHLKCNLISPNENLPPFERDLLNFGIDNFVILPIAELNNEANAKEKANNLIKMQKNPYNIFYYEV